MGKSMHGWSRAAAAWTRGSACLHAGLSTGCAPIIAAANRGDRMGRLSSRQKRLLEEIPRSKSLAEAARRAGYSPKFAGQAGYLALHRIAAKAPEALESSEMTLEAVIEKVIKPGLDAMRTIYFEHNGQVTDKREVPDWQSRLTMLKLTLKLHGVL